MLGSRSLYLGIVAHYRRSRDYSLGTCNVLRTMPNKDDGSEAGEALRNRRLAQIGPGNLVSQSEQYLSDTAHADTADAYKMNTLNFGEHARG